MVFLSKQRISGAFLPFLAASALLLAACGSQIDGIETPDVRPPSPAPAGIYEGTLSPEAGGSVIEVTALVSASRIYLFNMDGSFIAGGLYDTSERNLNLQARTFQPAAVAGDPVVVKTLTAQGGFDPEEDILLAYTGEFGTGTLTLDYQESDYERRSDLPLVAGTWVNQDQFGTDIVSFAISPSGDITPGRDQNCSYSGQLALIDQPYNLYNATLAPQCGANTPNPPPPAESGLATLRRESNGSFTLVIVTTTSNGAHLFQLRKKT